MKSISNDKIIEKNKNYIWHPFTQMGDYMQSDPLIIERGDGIKLIDIDGNSYYDGVSSLWVNIHGHRVSQIDDAIRMQLDTIAHSTLLGQANIPAILLAEKLVGLTPDNLTKVFYSDSGSEAVEIGLKIAYQYWKLKGAPERRSFAAMTNAYHGDTIGATSVGGMDLFHSVYKDLLFPTHQIPYPDKYRFNGTESECANYCISKLAQLLNSKGNEIAGLIVEPLVQGAAGMIMMPAGFMKDVERLCREFGVLLLADEVATGFGRTGKMFACDHEGIEPDIMMIAKGITGGYLPLAATLTSETIYSAFLGDYSEKKTFFHGHSYTGNQLGCAAALANIALFEVNNLVSEVSRKSMRIRQQLETLNDLSHVGDVRCKGLMAGIELVKNKKTKEPYAWEDQIGTKVCDHSRKLGMILRPLGNVVVFMPPLASTDVELEEMMTILRKAIVSGTRGESDQ
jgi:lysine--8-amino-7-oxononanoate aminotransferase